MGRWLGNVLSVHTLLGTRGQVQSLPSSRRPVWLRGCRHALQKGVSSGDTAASPGTERGGQRAARLASPCFSSTRGFFSFSPTSSWFYEGLQLCVDF